MSAEMLTEATALGNNYYRLRLTGNAGYGSGGNKNGEQVGRAIDELVNAQAVEGIIIDMSGLEYEWGNFFTSSILNKTFPRKRMCIYATGNTYSRFKSLWESMHMIQIIPLFNNDDETLVYMLRATT